jgi:hypothetical protein
MQKHAPKTFGQTQNIVFRAQEPIRQSLYLQVSTFDFYRTYFLQTLLIQGYLLILTYHLSGVYMPKPVWHYPWHYGFAKKSKSFAKESISL